jgi:hypothetical protein
MQQREGEEWVVRLTSKKGFHAQQLCCGAARSIRPDSVSNHCTYHHSANQRMSISKKNEKTSPQLTFRYAATGELSAHCSNTALSEALCAGARRSCSAANSTSARSNASGASVAPAARHNRPLSNCSAVRGEGEAEVDAAAAVEEEEEEAGLMAANCKTERQRERVCGRKAEDERATKDLMSEPQEAVSGVNDRRHLFGVFCRELNDRGRGSESHEA